MSLPSAERSTRVEPVVMGVSRASSMMWSLMVIRLVASAVAGMVSPLGAPGPGAGSCMDPDPAGVALVSARRFPVTLLAAPSRAPSFSDPTLTSAHPNTCRRVGRGIAHGGRIAVESQVTERSDGAISPGSLVEVRDETWLVTSVENTPDGPLYAVRGVSDFVKDTTASFYA